MNPYATTAILNKSECYVSISELENILSQHLANAVLAQLKYITVKEIADDIRDFRVYPKT